MRESRVLLIAVVVLLAVAQASATDPTRVLTENQAPVVREIETNEATWLAQPPNQANGIFSDATCDFCGGTPQVLAENFVISTGGVGVNMNQAVIWGGYFPGNVPTVAAFEIIFHNDAAGLPGAVVCQYSVFPTSDILTGVVLFNVDEHEVTLDFPDCTLADGTYFIEIYTDTGPGTDDWFWETGVLDGANGVPGQAYAFEAPGVTWNYDPAQDMAITLNGDLVPVELQSFTIE